MLCSVLVTLALIVTMFTACGDKPEEETTTTTIENQSVSIDENGFTVEIEDTQAIVKKDGKEFQILKFPVNPNVVFDKSYAQEHNEFLDMNFDGQPDFYIAVCSVDGVISYYCWLYNATTNQFDYSILLSALKNISVDAENHRILSTVKNGDSSLVVSYHWVDGELALEKKYDNSSDAEEITKVVEDNAIGVDKPTTKPSSETKETTKKTDNSSNTNKPSSDKPNNEKPNNKPGDTESAASTTKVNKPANTTTTKPYSGGVILAEGDIDEGWY